MTYSDAYIEGYQDSAYHPYDNPYEATNAELAAGYKDGYWDGKFRAPNKIREPQRYRRWAAAGESYGPFVR